jgi:hypothetical protein
MQNIHHTKLQVTLYDRFHSLLVAANLVIAFVFASLLAIWWSHEFQAGKTGPDDMDGTRLPLTQVSLEQTDFLFDILPPTAAPSLSGDLAAIPDVLSSIKANETKSLFDGIEGSEGSRELGPIGTGGGSGSPGTPHALPESKRWSVVSLNPDFDDYVQMLDFFEIEVGVIRLSSNEVIRIASPGLGSHVIQSDRTAEKTSFYFCNTQTISRRWDARIVRDADIVLADSAVVHFYPEQTLARLRAAELKQVSLDEKGIDDVLTTRFAIVSTDSGFEFGVNEIEYR